MVIGNKNSGKSSLLQNSDLNLFKKDKEKQKDNSDLDFLFSDKAVMLNCNFLFQNKMWTHFLSLIKRIRPKMPINGIIYTLSLKELIKAFENNTLGDIALCMQEKINELYNKLGFIFSVTLIITKIDKIPGFSDFFTSLDPKEKDESLGTNSAEYEVFLEEIYHKLARLRLDKISKTENIKSKIKIYAFPEKFKHYMEITKNFLDLLLKESIYREKVDLHGIYLTANIKTEKENTSYFVNNIFKRIIFSGSDPLLIKDKNIFKRLQQSSKLPAYIILCSALVFLTFVFFKNIALINKGETIAKNLASDSSLKNLLLANNFYQIIKEEKVHFCFRLGLYGADIQTEQLKQMLLYVLKNKFLQALGKELTDKLIKYSKEPITNRGAYYNALEAYLLLSGAKNIGINQSAYILMYYWKEILKKQEIFIPINKNLMNLIYLFLNQKAKWSLDQKLVNKARQKLYIENDVVNLYAGMDFFSRIKLPPLSLKDLMGKKNKSFSSDYKIPSFYTLKGLDEIMKPSLMKITKTKRDWVLNIPISKNAKYQIENLYLDNYKKAWLKFLNSITIQLANRDKIRDESFKEEFDELKNFSSILKTNGPIVNLLRCVLVNTKLPWKKEAIVDLRPILGKPINAYLLRGTKIIDLMNKLSRENPSIVKKYATNVLSGNTSTALYRRVIETDILTQKIKDQETQKSVKNFLLQPIKELWKIILSASTYNLNEKWNQKIYNRYENLFDNFPFNSNSKEDVKISKITDFLGSKGALWQFVDKCLRDFLSYNLGEYSKKLWLGEGIDLNKNFLKFLIKSRILSNELFKEKTKEPELDYYIYPIPTPDLSEIIFVFNGKKYIYDNGPQIWKKLTWKFDNDSSKRTYISAILGNHFYLKNIKEFAGAWGLFHLIKEGTLTLKNTQYKINWILQKHKKYYHVKVLIRTNGKLNIFYELLHNKFNLPQRIVH